MIPLIIDADFAAWLDYHGFPLEVVRSTWAWILIEMYEDDIALGRW